MGGRPFAVPRWSSWCVVVAHAGRAARGRAPAQPTAPRASPAEAAAALAAFVDAVEARDAQALRGAGARRATRLRTTLLVGHRGQRRARSTSRDVDARYVDQVGTVAADGSWTGVVELDLAARRLRRSAGAQPTSWCAFAPDGDGLGIAGFGAPTRRGTSSPLGCAVELSRAPRPDGVLVMVDGPQAEADAVAATGGAGHRRRAPRPARLERAASSSRCPPAPPHLDETLGADPGTYAGIAAVTATVGEPADAGASGPRVRQPRGHRRAAPRGRAGGDEPRAGPRRHRRGAQAGRAVAARGLRRLRRAARHAAAGPRHPGTGDRGGARDGVPDALPAAADFDTRARDLQARYEEAWLACRIVAERLGERGLLSGLPTARRRRARWTAVAASARAARRRLTEPWRDRLRAGPRPATDGNALKATGDRSPSGRRVHDAGSGWSTWIRAVERCRQGSEEVADAEPKAVDARMMAMAMKPTMRPYSTAVAPRSSDSRLRRRLHVQVSSRLWHRHEQGPAPPHGAAPALR